MLNFFRFFLIFVLLIYFCCVTIRNEINGLRFLPPLINYDFSRVELFCCFLGRLYRKEDGTSEGLSNGEKSGNEVDLSDLMGLPKVMMIDLIV